MSWLEVAVPKPSFLHEHAVAVGVEPVVFGDGVTVDGEDFVCPAQGADEHQEGRLRQVEVGEKGVDDFEVVSGIDKQVRFSGTGHDIAGMLAGSEFQRADRGGADGDDASRLATRLPDFLGGGFGDGVGLGVKTMLLDSFRTDRLKSSETHMERNLRGFNAAGADAGKNPGSEMETGGRRGDGSALAGVNSLVAFAVGGGIFAGDVGRKRDVSDLVDAGEKILDGIEADAAFSERSAGEDFGVQLVVVPKEKMFADIDLATRTDETLPVVGILLQLASEEGFDASVKKLA